MNGLFADQSPVVSATLLVLILLSVVTWSIALYKFLRQIQEKNRSRDFLASFWAARDWTDAADKAEQGQGDVARLAQSGFSELSMLGSDRQDLLHTGAPQEILERRLSQQLQNIQRYHERGQAELATIGSTAPFVGLFGTVWGIMHALQNIGQSGTASLDVVAGPIGEALIATAIGIATALPAVLFYNYYLRNLRLRVTELENFAHDFMRLAIKHNFKG
ncbi:MAG: MotA/TolQ/ExbB proton channel family protein [Gallionella sp.]|nr:MotA/TolQ/ExbB proton channel family protein [Gallionella sp.]MDD4945987.1 MotA/TolQ/ExbB proton channel family protein [Gallionella sp.]MDD5612560.1 MotA/TolQ/ExbB proton channel family protein [Gallionella sp.]